MTTDQVRVAIVQLHAHPAYGTSSSLTAEPTGEDMSLDSAVPPHVLQPIRDSTARTYSDNLSHRLEAVLRFCADQAVQVVAFPEYSIPVRLLPKMQHWASAFGFHIIAGSHTVTTSNEHVYNTLGLALDCSPSVAASHLGMSVSPCLSPDGKHFLQLKKRKSYWETTLKGSREPWNWHQLTVGGHPFDLGVAACSDLSLLNPLPLPPSGCGLLVIQSHASSPAEIYEVDQFLKSNNLPVAYVNNAAHGNSAIFARFTNTSHLASVHGTKPIDPETEAVVIADIALRSTVNSGVHRPDIPTARVVSIAPLLYLSNQNHQICSDSIVEAKESGDYQRLVAIGALPDTPAVLRRNLQAFDRTQRHPTLNKHSDSLLAHIPIPPPAVPLPVLQIQLLTRVFEEVLKSIQSGSPDRTKALSLLTDLDSKIQKRKAQVSTVTKDAASGPESRTPPTGTKAPFIDRDQQMDTIRNFSNNTAKRVLSLFGMRGIGKTRLVEEALLQVFPNRTNQVITLTEGAGFPRLILELAYRLNIPVPDEARTDLDNPNVYDPLISRVLSAFDRLPAACLILDDCHHLLSKNGIRDPRFARFLEGVLARESYQNNKVILVSKQAFSPPVETDSFQPLRISGLSDTAMRGVLDWHVKSQRGDASPVRIPAALIERLHGNPLAALVAAQLLDQFSPEAIVQHSEVQKQFQERLIPQLLEQLRIGPEEIQLIQFTSIFNAPIPYEALKRSGVHNTDAALSNLVDKFLLEFDTESQGYRVHPLIREHFRSQVIPQTRVQYHRIAASIYEPLTRGNDGDPMAKAEWVSHLAGAGELQRAKRLQFIYYDELRPIAWRLFKERNYQTALKYYEVLLQFRDSDFDVHFHIALCHGRLRQWEKAASPFERATTLNPTGWWQYTGLADAMIATRHNIAGAEKYLLQALEIAAQVRVPTWKYSAIYISLGKVYRLQNNRPYADRFFNQAVQTHQTSAFAHYELAKHLLYTDGDLSIALHHVREAMRLDRSLEASERLEMRILDAIALTWRPGEAEMDDDDIDQMDVLEDSQTE